MILSLGEPNTLCGASVSSMTPRFGARCPARRATVWMMTWRISTTSRSSSARLSRLRSAGECTRSRMLMTRPGSERPVPEDRGAHAEHGSDQHLERGVPQQLHQLLGALPGVREVLVDQTVEHHRLSSRRTPQTRGIIHNDQAEI